MCGYRDSVSEVVFRNSLFLPLILKSIYVQNIPQMYFVSRFEKIYIFSNLDTNGILISSLIKIEFNTLCQRNILTIINGIGLTTHVSFP